MKQLLFLLFFTGCCARMIAQLSAQDSILRANAYVIHLNEEGALTGPGADLLLKKAADAQFVSIGENHNTKEIPQFTTAVFNTLYKHYGYRHLALEQDPVMMHKISAWTYKGNRDSILSLARQYPYGFTFISDEELDMLAHVSKYPAKGNIIWGCDQSFGRMQVIDEIKKDMRNAVVPDSLVNQLSASETKRDLEKKQFKKIDLSPLNKYKTGKADNEIDFGLASLAMSDSIYSLMTTERPYEGCELREAYMKRRFMDEYKMCISAGEQYPKVLLKLGTSHILDGYEPHTGSINLGTFVKELAIAHGMTSFSINAAIYRTDSSDWNFNRYDGKAVLQLFARNARVDSWTIFDLEPLKAWYYDGKLKGIIAKEDRSFFENYILAFDLLLLIGNGDDATFNICKCDY